MVGIGRDRNTVEDRLLVLGIPQMFEVIRSQMGQDEQLGDKYKSDIGKLAMLMTHEGTALSRLADPAVFNCFQHAEHDQRQLAEALHQWFQEQYPASEQFPRTLPVCSHGSKAAAIAEVACCHCMFVLKFLIEAFLGVHCWVSEQASTHVCAMLAAHLWGPQVGHVHVHWPPSVIE